MAWPENIQANDVVKVEWDKITLQDKVDQFFKEKEEAKWKIDVNGKVAEIDVKIDKNNTQYNELYAELTARNGVLKYTSPPRYNEIVNTLRDLESQNKAYEKEKSNLLNQERLSPIVSTALTMRKNLNDEVSNINRLISSIGDPRLRKEILQIAKQAIEENFSGSLQDNVDAGEALLSAVRLVKHTEVSTVIEVINEKHISSLKSDIAKLQAKFDTLTVKLAKLNNAGTQYEQMATLEEYDKTLDALNKEKAKLKKIEG